MNFHNQRHIGPCFTFMQSMTKSGFTIDMGSA